MNIVTILWSLAAGACLLLAVVQLLVWAHDRRARANLWLALLAVSVVAIAAGAVRRNATHEARVGGGIQVDLGPGRGVGLVHVGTGEIAGSGLHRARGVAACAATITTQQRPHGGLERGG